MRPETESRIVIIGAGPCGLACARELERLGHRNWTILEREQEPGGLARSILDPAGFTWDLGGHVVFSHFGEFDALLREVMNGDTRHHERSSYIRFADRWVPYPFQNNLRHLPEDVVAECLEGLAQAPGGDAGLDFGTWMRAVFGEGITRHFMAPYNYKVWATPSAQMSSGWIAERVSVIDYERVLANIENGRDDLAWGPNNTFVFPATGGTGEIYRRLSKRLEDRIRYGSTVAEIDPASRRLRTTEGLELAYDALITSMPLDTLVASCGTARARSARRPRPCGTTGSTWSASATRRRWPTPSRGCTSRPRRCRSTGPPTSPSTPRRTSRAATSPAIARI